MILLTGAGQRMETSVSVFRCASQRMNAPVSVSGQIGREPAKVVKNFPLAINMSTKAKTRRGSLISSAPTTLPSWDGSLVLSIK